MKYKSLLAIPFLILAGCASANHPYNFKMDYPVDAARLSLSGSVVAMVDCDNKTADIISDTSGGVFSRHVKKRIHNICYGKTGVSKVEYDFNAPRTAKNDMIATQPARHPDF